MTTNSVSLAIDGERVAESLREVREKLDGAEGEVVLDFSSVTRLAPAAVTALEQLAAFAATKNLKIVLHGVHVDVYRVIKLSKLASRFSFPA